MEGIKNIKISEIGFSKFELRSDVKASDVSELSNSIKENGLLHPIVVREKITEDGKKYELVSGRRRLVAYSVLGKKVIPSEIRKLDDKEAALYVIVENLQREDIDPFDEAKSVRKLSEVFGMTVKEISHKIGKSISFVNTRLQLNNRTPEFEKLFRAGVINLNHLIEVCKLTESQQAQLYKSCFNESTIDRWEFKTLKLETLREWINEKVYSMLSTAKFSLEDSTYKTCKACSKCKFNSLVAYPGSGEDAFCMNHELFNSKNIEAVIRKGKESGCPIVYVGTQFENEEILSASAAYNINPQPLHEKEYIIEPTAPNLDNITGAEKKEKRIANYERLKSVFEENVKAGYVVKVFELCYNGVLSGEFKYLYNVQYENSQEINVNPVESLTAMRTEFRGLDDKAKEDRVERQRVFIENSDYSGATNDISDIERNVFYSLLLSHLPIEFVKSIGIDLQTEVKVSDVFNAIVSHKVQIIRAYIKNMLSDKSVGYSDNLAKMLDMVMTNQFGRDVKEIDKALDEDYKTLRESYESKINELQSQIDELKKKSDGSYHNAEPTEKNNQK